MSEAANLCIKTGKASMVMGMLTGSVATLTVALETAKKHGMEECQAPIQQAIEAATLAFDKCMFDPSK